MAEELPVDAIRDQLLRASSRPSARVLLKAPTGSGKSTRVPLMLLEDDGGQPGLIVVVQPRRIAARMLADYVAGQLEEKPGGRVGYIVRFDRRVSERTRIIYITDGILQRWLLGDDPALDRVKTVVFDEFHERSLAGDLCLPRILDLQRKRPGLSVVVMSATIQTGALSDYLGPECASLEAWGRAYPVAVEYSPTPPVSDGRGRMIPVPLWEQAAAAARREAARDDCGDILIFMPGVYEIRKTVELLQSKSWAAGREILPLYGTLTPDQQAAAVRPSSSRRIIVSTNVAETSLTISGVKTVIDTGVARYAGWDARRGMNTLFAGKISRSSADQRAGRAGRLAPGRAVRLWSAADHAKRPEFETPEALRIDLSEAVLILKSWGVHHPEQFPWIDRPSDQALSKATALLEQLEAVDGDGAITDVGRQILSYPLDPRLARLIVAAGEEGGSCLREAIAVASLIQSEPIALKSGLHESLTDARDCSDFQREWRAALKAEQLRYNPVECGRLGIMARSAREIIAAWRQNMSLAGQKAGDPAPLQWSDELTRCLLKAYSDHIGVRNGVAANTCRLADGKRGRLQSGTAAMLDILFVAAEIAEIGAKQVETRVSRCTSITHRQLEESFPADFSSLDAPVYDEARKRVVIRRKTLFRDLVIEDIDKGDASAEQAAPILARLISDGTLRLGKWDDRAEQWIRRLNLVADYMPELELSPFTGDDREVAFAILCEGAVGYKEVRERDVMPVLQQWLSGWQRDALDRYAPVSLQLSNGSQAKIRYGDDGAPTISLTVQKLFGVLSTPAIMDGRLPLKMEVLAPNQRPWQITASLETFWINGYPAMKKDLAGRYPRHHWPDKPPGL